MMAKVEDEIKVLRAEIERRLRVRLGDLDPKVALAAGFLPTERSPQIEARMRSNRMVA